METLSQQKQGGIIMRINHNVAALNTYSRLAQATGAQAKSLEKLSSGLRITRAGDDAAGLAISEKMRAQIKGLDQSSRNAQDGISMIQTAEGALNETHSMLQRMRELAVQSNNDTNNTNDRQAIQKEVDALNNEVNRIANKTTFNTKNLLDGSLGVRAKTSAGTTVGVALAGAGVTVSLNGVAASSAISVTSDSANKAVTIKIGTTTQTISVGAGSVVSAIKAGTVMDFDKVGVKLEFGGIGNLKGGAFDGTMNASSASASFQIGANASTTLDITISDMQASALGKTAVGGVSAVNKVNVITKSFDANLATIDQAIKDVSDQRGQLGAWQNRLEHTISNLTVSSENLTAAESRVRDVDMAKEMMEFTKNNILNQASTAMLAQANQQPQGVLQLLR
jgi:flagellin